MSRYPTEIVSGTGIPPRRKPFALLEESGITINGLVRTVTGALVLRSRSGGRTPLPNGSTSYP
ncbi:hypothetical protein FFLO_02109 [Filobasidium floriforme]|uniref:Uncharacterized protein n=1 Tax=Filobasidium floriforme TaxID=5210 RepID=A0A8K0JQ63_9TREE|nr:hypothetical protein FFLO_02109 [Filobasidium floriforme]